MSDYPVQSMTPVSNVYALPNCAVSLYATGASGALGALVWAAQQVETLHVRESYNEVEHWPTGVPYPSYRHVGERHELQFDAVWNVAAGMTPNVEYILAVTWQNATLSGVGSHWVRRYYVGVTHTGREIGSRDGNEFVSGNSLRAKYFNETRFTSAPAAVATGGAIC